MQLRGDVDGCDDVALARVKGGVTVVERVIELVVTAFATVACVLVVRGIIQRVRPGVAKLEAETVSRSLGHIGLEGVVVRRSLSPNQAYARERRLAVLNHLVASDGVLREIVVLSIADRTVARVGAVDRLTEDRRVLIPRKAGRVACLRDIVPFSHDLVMTTQRRHIAEPSHDARRQLTLHRQLNVLRVRRPEGWTIRAEGGWLVLGEVRRRTWR